MTGWLAWQEGGIPLTDGSLEAVIANAVLVGVPEDKARAILGGTPAKVFPARAPLPPGPLAPPHYTRTPHLWLQLTELRGANSAAGSVCYHREACVGQVFALQCGRVSQQVQAVAAQSVGLKRSDSFWLMYLLNVDPPHKTSDDANALQLTAQSCGRRLSLQRLLFSSAIHTAVRAPHGHWPLGPPLRRFCEAAAGARRAQGSGAPAGPGRRHRPPGSGMQSAGRSAQPGRPGRAAMCTPTWRTQPCEFYANARIASEMSQRIGFAGCFNA